MIEALNDDQKDIQFLKEKKRPNWIIDMEKIPEAVLDYPELIHSRREDRIVLPFLIGESIMISHVVFASTM
jgi:hypothetical protein